MSRVKVQRSANTDPRVSRDVDAPLPSTEAAFFSRGFGHDLSHVRVHSGPESTAAARSMNASAFTLGNHIVMGDTQYRHGTQRGRELLAHELAHVVQQRATIPRPSSWLAAPLRTTEGDRYERHAQTTADAVLRGSPMTAPALHAPPMIARQPKPPTATKDDEEEDQVQPAVDQWKGTPISRMIISLARGRVAMVMASGALTGDVTTDLKPGLYKLRVDPNTPNQWEFIEPKVPSGVRFSITLDHADPWTLSYPAEIPLEVVAGSAANVDDKMPWKELQKIIMVDPEFVFEHMTPEPVNGDDDFETAKYKLDYKAKGGNLSNVILVEYRNGTTKDFDIPTITQATPRLWEAKQQALKIMGQYNFEFMLGTFTTIWFILTMATPIEVPNSPKGNATKLETPRPKIESPGPKIETPAPKIESPAPKIESPAPKIEAPGPKIESPAPKVKGPTPKVETPAPKVEPPAPKIEAPGPKVETPAPKNETPAPKVEQQGPKVETPSGNDAAPVPKAPDGPVPPGYRAEPSLKNSGWGPRPEGGDAGAAYAEQACGSKESLYVHGLKDELGGTGVVELDGVENQILLDAKDAGPKSMYDVSGTDKFTQNFKIPKVLAEAMRQGWAMIRSGAKGIEWRISNEKVAQALAKLFADKGVKITVKYVPKAAPPPVP